VTFMIHPFYSLPGLAPAVHQKYSESPPRKFISGAG